MTINELPTGSAPPAIHFPHFPTLWQAVLWRNWELVSVTRLARILETSEGRLLDAARALGLPTPPDVQPAWIRRGYATLIRANWHLLPYGQLLDLLGWTPDQMFLHLQEDDFLWTKLGYLKPACETVRFTPLTLEQVSRTACIREALQDFHSENRPRVPPFAFVEEFERPLPVSFQRTAQDRTNEPASFSPLFIYSYSATYGDPLSDPQADPLPEGLLARYADRGITGVWLPVTLHRLCPIPGAGPELSDGWDRRLIQLRALAERTRRHGIGLYLYLNEPRGLSAAGFRGLESWKGVEEKKTGNFAFCTSNPETLEYVKAACSRVFKAAPALAGAFTISMSENLTHCHSRWNGSGCPRCANRPVPEVVAEVNRHIEEGIHAVAPDARVIVWTWAWDPAWAPGAVDLLPDSVDLMCVSEWGKKLSIGGVANRVVDYSISQPGPSEETVALWEHAARRGLRTLAKVQFNTCWECSAVPYIPVPYLVQEHLDGLRSSGVSGLLLSWTLGGYPGGNLDLLETTPEELSRRLYGSVAPDVQQAWRTFGEAFREFPFQVEVLYNSPHNLGPANLLFAEPTGYASSLVGFPYDDLSHWRGAYPEDLFESQFRKVSEGWAEGLDGLRRAEPRVESRHESEFQALMRIATAVYSHFRSAYLQIRFIRLRADPSAEARDAIRKVLEEERQLARTLAHAAAQDSTLGFEATNHYAYTQNDLKEKVLNCCYLLESLKKGTPS